MRESQITNDDGGSREEEGRTLVMLESHGPVCVNKQGLAWACRLDNEQTSLPVMLLT